jgi:tetratricopeptide (TPR) repeat protein
MYSTIERLIKEHKPKLVISMLGKSEIITKRSDTVVKKLGDPFYENFLVYKISRSIIQNTLLSVRNNFIRSHKIENDSSAYSELKDLDGKNLLDSNKFEEALIYFNTKLDQDKTSYEILSIISDLQIKLGKFHEAISSLKKLIERDPTDPPSYNALSFSYQQINDYKNAFFWANRGNELFPNSPSILKRLIELNELIGKYHDFLYYIEKLYKVPGQKAYANFYFGRYYYIKKDYLKSLEFLKYALNEHPDKSLVHLHLGHTYLKLEENDKCLLQYQKAVKTDLYNNNKHFNFLIRAVEFHKLDKAKEFYIDDLLVNHPDEERFFIPISRTLLELKRYKESYSLLARFLKNHPTDSYANKTLEILKSETQNIKDFNIEDKTKSRQYKSHLYSRDFLEVYPLLAQNILNSGSFLVVMQYPDTLLSDIKVNNFPKSTKILFIDNLKLIKEQVDQDISKYFVWDAIHLTDLGDKVLVKNLIHEINKNNIIEQ